MTILYAQFFLERDHSVYNLFLLLNFNIQHESKTGEQEIVNLKIPPRQEKKSLFEGRSWILYYGLG